VEREGARERGGNFAVKLGVCSLFYRGREVATGGNGQSNSLKPLKARCGDKRGLDPGIQCRGRLRIEVASQG
jgi:hypothetical protein